MPYGDSLRFIRDLLYIFIMYLSRIWSYVSQHFLRREFTTDTDCYYRMPVKLDGSRRMIPKNF